MIGKNGISFTTFRADNNDKETRRLYKAIGQCGRLCVNYVL